MRLTHQRGILDREGPVAEQSRTEKSCLFLRLQLPDQARMARGPHGGVSAAVARKEPGSS